MGLDTSSNEPSGIRARFRSVLPSDRFGDQLAILSGTSQNIAGLAIYVVASLGTNVLISRVLGASALGVVTLATQFAFVAGAATRFGMDAATVRQVAIDVGGGRAERVRSVMTRAAASSPRPSAFPRRRDAESSRPPRWRSRSCRCARSTWAGPRGSRSCGTRSASSGPASPPRGSSSWHWAGSRPGPSA